MTRYDVDGSWWRHDEVIVAGSPLRVFRLTGPGTAVAGAIETGAEVPGSVLVERLLDAGAIHPRPDRDGHHRYGLHDVTIVTPVFRRPGAHDVSTIDSSTSDSSTSDSSTSDSSTSDSSTSDSSTSDSSTSDSSTVDSSSSDGAGAHEDDAGPLPAASGGPARIVVDDGSEPPIAGATVRLDHNRGPGAARNAGAALATTPLVAFVDDDVELPDGWLDALLPHFDRDGIGLVAPRVRSRPGPGRIARIERTHSPLDLGDTPARIRAGTRVSYVPAAAIVIRADALAAIGGFDESLRFGEDVDVVWRLDEAGWGCRYEPSSVVRHAPRTTWAGWARQRIGYGSSTAPLARRHPGALSPVRINRWSLAAWAAVPIWPTAGVVIGIGTAAALPRKLPMLPRRVAFGLAARGTARAGGQLADAVRRVWWPILTVAALRSRYARRVLVASWIAAGSPARAAGDLCSSIGIWHSVLRERDPAALVPQLDPWPPSGTARAPARAPSRAPVRAPVRAPGGHEPDGTVPT